MRSLPLFRHHKGPFPCRETRARSQNRKLIRLKTTEAAVLRPRWEVRLRESVPLGKGTHAWWTDRADRVAQLGLF